MFKLKKVAALCSSLCLFGSGNARAAGNIKSLQNCSDFTQSNVESGEFIGDEINRTKIEGNKKSQLGAETFFGNGALSSKRKEALRARGAQSILNNNEVRKLLADFDSDKLRKISKDKQRLSNALYALSWPSILLALGVPMYDVSKGIRMQLIYQEFEKNVEQVYDNEGKSLREVMENFDKEYIYIDTWASLFEIAIGYRKVKSGEQKFDWEGVKEYLKQKSEQFKTKLIDPMDEWVRLLRSFGTKETKNGGYVRRDLVGEAVVLKDLAYIFFGGLASTALNSVLNNLSQREQGKSDELNILANRVDKLNKMEKDKMSFTKRYPKAKIANQKFERS